MKLSAPKNVTFVVALVLGVLGILGSLVTLPVVTPAIALWLLVVGFVVLVLGNLLNGL